MTGYVRPLTAIRGSRMLRPRPKEVPMAVRETRWVLPIAFAMLVALVGGTSPVRAANDVIPPRLTCVDGLFTRTVPRPGEHARLRRRRWLCDVDGQGNGVCTFGRRCRPSRLLAQGFESGSFRCRVTVPVAIGEQRQQGPVTLVCAANRPPTPCGPTLSCDTASEVCVAREHGGPAVDYACEPVPAGCESDRSCSCAGASLCQGVSGACRDEG